jgi:ElaB/YqjD/DUF883 family membrane-anchored ribosome-binding protein
MVERNSLRDSDRHFPWIKVSRGDSMVGAHTLACARCGATDDVLDQNSRPLPSLFIRKKFMQKGWDVGANPKHDVCPACVAQEREDRRKRRAAATTNVVAINQREIAPVSKTEPANDIDAPPQMTRDDRRIIFQKLNEVYLSEAEGYSSPWTDQAVAKDIGCPLAWVQQLRDENFGPARDNAEIRALLEKAEKFLAGAQSALKEARNIRSEAAALIQKANHNNGELAKLSASIDAMSNNIERIKEALS